MIILVTKIKLNIINPIVHSHNSIKRFGGNEDEDFHKYLAIHKKMDCSKAYFSDNRHRVLTHHMFWVNEVMLPIFGDYIILENTKKVSVKDICEQHILEDFRMKFIPSVHDYLSEVEMKRWMQNGAGVPDSAKKLYPELVKPMPPPDRTLREGECPTPPLPLKTDNGESDFWKNWDMLKNNVLDGGPGRNMVVD